MAEQIPKLKESLKLFRRLIQLIKPYWSKLIKGMSLGVVVGVLGMVTPFLTKLLIDEVYPTEDVSLMHVLVGGVLAVSITSTLIRTVQSYFNLYVNSRLSNSLSLLFFNHLQHLRVRFFDEHRVGEIMSRFKDVSAALKTVNTVFQAIFVDGIYLLLVPPFLFFLQWKLAIVALVSVPFTMIIITLTGRIIRKYWKKSSEAYADLNAFQFETLTHIRALKTMALEKYVYNENEKQMKNALDLQLKAGGLGQLLGVSNGVLYALSTALFTWLGWTYILTNQMSLGDFIAFSAYIGYLYNPISKFVNLYSEFQQSAVNLNRMFEYLDSPTEIDPNSVRRKSTAPLKILKGTIELEDVTFGYSERTEVLHNINLKIEPKQITSIIGPSGSGKTTLLRLIAKMEIPDKGKIYYDGIPSTEFGLQEVRQQISVVWQEFSMLRGSIWQNLTLGTENVNSDKVLDAVRVCRMNDVISKLPEGYDTPIAEWGASLSGGQRQRLAIARALIRNTPILIFDEATSNIDIETESEMLNEIFNQYGEKTTIFVTHRVHSAKLADKICLLIDGVIVDSGNHDELMQKSEDYRNMINTNSKPSDYSIHSIK